MSGHAIDAGPSECAGSGVLNLARIRRWAAVGAALRSARPRSIDVHVVPTLARKPVACADANGRAGMRLPGEGLERLVALETRCLGSRR